MIVLNEKEYVEEHIKNKDIGESPFFTLSVMARYYHHCFGYKNKKVSELLTNFLRENYQMYKYSKSSWDETVEKISKNAGKYKLHELDGIWITKSELATIEGINDKTLERLAFTLLCLAKFYNSRNPKNNSWVNVSDKEIFSFARINCGTFDRAVNIGKLHELSLIEFPKRNDNLSNRVTFIDDESEDVLFISDFRELGYEYLKYKGEDFIRCRECGILVRQSKNGMKKYCTDCVKYTPKEKKEIICIDCGHHFFVDGSNKRTYRCNDCQSKKNRESKLKYWNLKVKEKDDY